MGLNAYFAFTIVPELGGNWQLGLGCVFVSGLLFFALSAATIDLAILAGFFLALIALENAGIVADDPATLVTLGDLGEPKAWLAACGFQLISGLALRKMPGAIILGVLAVTVAAVASVLSPGAGSRRRRRSSSLPPLPAPIAFARSRCSIRPSSAAP